MADLLQAFYNGVFTGMAVAIGGAVVEIYIKPHLSQGRKIVGGFIKR